ncbi:MAG: hypothetical protein M4579_004286 [Chaenotheca gracillima]|nr:MAG: hypothetical protein M4579_004286 [Chaenotheca gracillima]
MARPQTQRRRTFELHPPSNDSSRAPSPVEDTSPTTTASTNELKPPANTSFPQSRSILNLTSSTLFGIYSPSSFGDKTEPPTPAGTGAETPARPWNFESTPNSRRTSLENGRSTRLNWESSPAFQRMRSGQSPVGVTDPQNPAQRHQRKPSQPRVTRSGSLLRVISRETNLFLFGVAYGIIITLLHNNRNLTPVRVDGINRYDWRYYLFWGLAGVALGNLLPWVDVLFLPKQKRPQGEALNDAREGRRGSSARLEDDEESPSKFNYSVGIGADWNPVVRSLGAFMGIAFAIRKLPWQSTLQVSLTLALVNPVLWYLIDRSKPGFFLSTFVGLSGTALLLSINPELVPPPTTSSPAFTSRSATTSPLASSSSRPGLNTSAYLGWPVVGTGSPLTAEHIGVTTWIASVLFCSCVCFGNVGRRLAQHKSSSP